MGCWPCLVPAACVQCWRGVQGGVGRVERNNVCSAGAGCLVGRGYARILPSCAGLVFARLIPSPCVPRAAVLPLLRSECAAGPRACSAAGGSYRPHQRRAQARGVPALPPHLRRRGGVAACLGPPLLWAAHETCPVHADNLQSLLRQSKSHLAWQLPRPRPGRGAPTRTRTSTYVSRAHAATPSPTPAARAHVHAVGVEAYRRVGEGSRSHEREGMCPAVRAAGSEDPGGCKEGNRVGGDH